MCDSRSVYSHGVSKLLLGDLLLLALFTKTVHTLSLVTYNHSISVTFSHVKGAIEGFVIFLRISLVRIESSVKHGRMLVMVTFGERLRELRKMRDLTQEQLAEELQVGRAALARWETKDANPDRDTLVKIASFFNITTDYLLGRTEHSEQKRPANIYPVEGLRAVPVIGTIPAGMPLLAIEEVSETMLLPEELLPNGKNVFLLRVKGDSMVDEKIFDGDLVLINADDRVDDMDIGAVLLDEEEVTLKKIHYFDGFVSLIPANNEYMPTTHRADEVRVLGRWESTIHSRRR